MNLVINVKSEISAINRELVYVPSATVLSLDDDHLRIKSWEVVELTYLQQCNNPKKVSVPSVTRSVQH